MKLKTLELTNFKGFKRPRLFTFPDKPGLYFLTGKNEVNPRLGANAVGKSTLWDALFWLFFEKTPKGLKAGDVACWGKKETVTVALEYEVEGKPFKAIRTWSPNKWWIESEEGTETLVADESNLLLSHLGAGFTPFLNSILMAQNRPMFLDLKSEAMSSVVSEVLNLDHWLDLSMKASRLATMQDQQSRQLEARRAELVGVRRGLSTAGTQQTASEWEARRNEELDRLEQRHREKLKDFNKLVAQLEEARTWAQEATKTLAVAKEKTEQQQVVCRRKDQAVQAASSQVNRLKGEAKTYEAELEELKHSEHCPSCLRGWSPQEKRHRRGVLEKKIKDLGLEEQEEKLAQLKEEQRKANALFDDLLDKESAANGVARESQRDLSSTENRKNLIDRELDQIEERAAQVSAEKNPAEKELADKERQLEKLGEELEGCEQKLADSAHSFMLKQFWSKGFKDIRLLEISEAMTQLEIEVNNALDQLGLAGWRIFFDPEKETKGGTLKRGFTVKVLSPDNEAPVHWESWSGGEAQRLRLAGNMGLSNLIRARLGVQLDLEVWDEPTQFLSPQGVTDLLDALKRRAQQEQRQIWVVDHRSLGYGDFDGAVTITKTSRGPAFEFSDCIDYLKGE